MGYRWSLIIFLYLTSGLFTTLYYEQQYLKISGNRPMVYQTLLVMAAWPIAGPIIMTGNWSPEKIKSKP